MKTVNVLRVGRVELWMVFKESVTSINNFIKMASFLCSRIRIPLNVSSRFLGFNSRPEGLVAL